ncbi:PH domain-containing protein [Alteromonas sp. CYL-A6]|uniref:PH domain-containing protein n=1 Tax=Alteromonas nitratireducens TaxID=3390813 RepID=UPI0034A75C24
MTSPADPSVTPSGADTVAGWQRLSAISIVHFMASSVKDMSQGLIYIIPAMAVTANVLDNIPGGRAPFIVLMILSVLGVVGLLNFLVYRFRVQNQHVEIKRGLLKRKYSNLPFWRIQNVKIEQPFYFRPFNYARVILDTAGSASDEAELVAVPLSYASNLKDQVLQQQQSRSDVPAEDNQSAPAEQVLNTRSTLDLVIHGITNNRVWIILGAAAPFIDNASNAIAEWLTANQLSLKQLAGEQAASWWQVGLYSLTIVLIVMMLLSLLSIAGAIFTFHGYTLTRLGDRYIRRSGLLNKHEVGMRASRIQVVAARQDWLDTLLKRVNLYFLQNVTARQGQKAVLMSASKLLVPSVTVDEARVLAREVLPDNQMYQTDYQPVTRRYLSHWAALWALPYSVLLTALVVQQHWQPALILSGVYALVVALLTLRWKRWGIAWDNRHVYVRSGLVGRDLRCFKHDKLQQISVRQSLWMRRGKVATVKFVLASGAITVPFLPEHTAYALANHVLYAMESRKRSWM